jgi:hypothetical protein
MSQMNIFGELVLNTDSIDEVKPIAKNIAYGGPMTVQDKQLFTFTDAIFASDRKTAWLLYQKLLSDRFDINGQIIPKIWWVLKSINAIRIDDTKDVKPSTLTKAKITNQKWIGDILMDRTLAFMEILAENRSGVGNDISTEIENWILQLP